MVLLQSYRTKVLAVALIIGLFPTISLSVFLYFDKVNTKIETLDSNLSEISRLQARIVHNWIEERKADVANIANNHVIITSSMALQDPKIDDYEKFRTKINLETQLKDVLITYPLLKQIILSNPITGEIFFHTGHSLKMTTLYKEEHFKQAVLGNTKLSDVLPAFIELENEYKVYDTGVPTLLISTPVSGDVGIEGILTARIDVFSIGGGDQFSVIDKYIVDSKGNFLTKPLYTPEIFEMNLVNIRPELELQIVEPNSKEFTKIFQLANKDSTRLILDGYKNYVGKTVVGAISPIEGTDWYYVVEIEEDAAFKEILILQIILFSSFLIIILAVIIIAVLFSNNLFTPIQNLTNVIAKFQASNIEQNIDQKTKSKNEFILLMETFEDMKKRIENSNQEIKRNELKFIQLYESSPDLLRTINTDGIIIDCNNQYTESLGYTKDEVLGKSIFEHIAHESIDALRDSVETWKKIGIVRNKEMVFQRKDGTKFPVLLSATSLYDQNGTIIGSNTIIHDISELKSAQDQIRQLQIKRLSVIGELAARLAHDLRNPLTVIKNIVEILNVRHSLEFSEKDKIDIDRLNRAINRMIHQIEHVMDFVRVKPLEIIETNLIEVVESAMDDIDVPDRITLSYPKEQIKIFCDLIQLKIVFINLITNAIQSIEEEGQIFIKAKEEKNFVIIEVEDTGPAIPEDVLEYIFEPLFTTKQIGTGLGLASCKTIVEQHGGTIKVKNNPVTFTIMLPKFKAEHTE